MSTRTTKLQNYHKCTLSLSNVAKNKQNYAPSVQKLKRVYCICFGNAPIIKHFFFENCGLNMQYINVPHIILGIINPLDQDYFR